MRVVSCRCTFRLRKRCSKSSKSFSPYSPYASAVKLPPEMPVIRSTSSSKRTVRPVGVATSIRRNVSRTPYASAAARVPPPEKARMTRLSEAPRFCSIFSN